VPAPELRLGNRTVYFRKAIRTPDFESERVLARDGFEFADLWLTRNCPGALPYWTQARAYYKASLNLPAQSSPLTIYYCFLNAVKALLLVKGVEFSDRHGVSGEFESSKRSLTNEKITFQPVGVLGIRRAPMTTLPTRQRASLICLRRATPLKMPPSPGRSLSKLADRFGTRGLHAGHWHLRDVLGISSGSCERCFALTES
jgi:hypothetical protein